MFQPAQAATIVPCIDWRAPGVHFALLVTIDVQRFKRAEETILGVHNHLMLTRITKEAESKTCFFLVLAHEHVSIQDRCAAGRNSVKYPNTVGPKLGAHHTYPKWAHRLPAALPGMIAVDIYLEASAICVTSQC